MEPTLERWMATAHDRLGTTVRALRVAVHAREPAADGLRTRLARDLLAHLDVEENAWIPAWSTDGGPFAPNATPAVLLTDHRQLRELLPDVPGTDRTASIARCDRLWRLQGVLEHHDVRERRSLVPWLVRHAPGSTLPPLSDPPAVEPPVPRPAEWATDRSDDPLADLVGALAGAAPDAHLSACADRLVGRTPHEARLVGRVTAVLHDRPSAWDALRLVRAVRGTI